MPFTERQLTSALATYLSKKNNKKTKTKEIKKHCVFFSSTKKTIYLYPFTDSAGGQDGVQWRADTCVQCYDCADRCEDADGETGRIIGGRKQMFHLFFSDVKALLELSLHRARLLTRPSFSSSTS